MRCVASTLLRRVWSAASLNATSGAVMANQMVTDRSEGAAATSICSERKNMTPRQLSAHSHGLAVTAATPAIAVAVAPMIRAERRASPRGRVNATRPAAAMLVQRTQLIPGRASKNIHVPNAAIAAAAGQSVVGAPLAEPVVGSVMDRISGRTCWLSSTLQYKEK